MNCGLRDRVDGWRHEDFVPSLLLQCGFAFSFSPRTNLSDCRPEPSTACFKRRRNAPALRKIELQFSNGCQQAVKYCKLFAFLAGESFVLFRVLRGCLLGYGPLLPAGFRRRGDAMAAVTRFHSVRQEQAACVVHASTGLLEPRPCDSASRVLNRPVHSPSTNNACILAHCYRVNLNDVNHPIVPIPSSITSDSPEESTTSTTASVGCRNRRERCRDFSNAIPVGSGEQPQSVRLIAIASTTRVFRMVSVFPDGESCRPLIIDTD